MAKKIRIACMGDSVTSGVGIELSVRARDSYPGQLQAMLGDTYEVLNFGRAGAYVVDENSKWKNPRPAAASYSKTEKYKEALVSNPDIVVLCLGSNDSRTVNKDEPESTDELYEGLIRYGKSMEELPSNPKIYIALSPYRYDVPVCMKNLDEAILPTQEKVARDMGWGFIDLHNPTKNAHLSGKEIYTDKAHMTKEGYEIMALEVKKALGL